ncbi:MAG TPA: hypothetical protein VHO27_08695 [Angustibacter sp.]|nr:hypothetical protein [Angustibacter sp.]
MSDSAAPTRPETGHARRHPPEGERAAGPRLLWFGVLGGSVAWALHLMVAWLAVELGCYQDHPDILGMSPRTVAVVATLLPGVVAVAALAVAVLALRAVRRRSGPDPTGRTRFMAEVAIGLDAFAVLMIVFGGLAVASMDACVR